MVQSCNMLQCREFLLKDLNKYDVFQCFQMKSDFCWEFSQLANDEQQSCRILGEKKIKSLQIYIVSDQLSDQSLFPDLVTFRSRN